MHADREKKGKGVPYDIYGAVLILKNDERYFRDLQYLFGPRY